MATAIQKNRKSGFYIGVTCPGCGGDLELEDNFFVIRCKHCGTGHRIVMPDVPPAYLIQAKTDARAARFSIDRYLKLKSLPLTDSSLQVKQVYYPYWKIDAVLFRQRNKRHERTVIEADQYQDAVTMNVDRTDVNLSPYTATVAAGIHYDGVPESIGMRAEYIRMIPYSEEHLQDDYDAISVLKGWEDVTKVLRENLATIGEIDMASFGTNRTEMFHPIASLVFFPYLLLESYGHHGYNRFIVDGVSGRVLEHVTRMDIFDSSTEQVPYTRFGSLTVEPHRCKTCGEDLPTEQSYIYICKNCHSLTSIESNAKPIEKVYVTENSGAQQDRLFPFWAFRLPSHDAERLRVLFGGTLASDYIVVPAFRMPNYDAMYRLGKRMSSAMPRFDLNVSEDWDRRCVSVSVSSTEGLAYATICIFREETAKGMPASFQRSDFNPSEVSLFFAPFHPESYFYVDSVINSITFEKTLVS